MLAAVSESVLRQNKTTDFIFRISIKISLCENKIKFSEKHNLRMHGHLFFEYIHSIFNVLNTALFRSHTDFLIIVLIVCKLDDKNCILNNKY